MPIADLTTLVNATAQNLSQLKGLSIAYNLLGGAPSIAGYTALINENNTSNFGAGAGVAFNDENVYINVLNALYQGNPDAKTAVDAIVGGGATLSDKLELVYNAVIPAASRTDAGLTYFKSQAAFYEARAAELGVAGGNGAALVAWAALSKIAVDNDIPGLGDTVNDLVAAVQDGSAALPEDGTAFTPLETADGTKFDGDDATAPTTTTTTLTVNQDAPAGTANSETINGVFTGAIATSTLQVSDVIDLKGGVDVLNLTDTVAGASALGAGTLPTLGGVDIVNATNVGGGALTVDTTFAPDATHFNVVSPAAGGDGVVWNKATLGKQEFGMSGNGVAAATTANFIGGDTGDADAVTVNLMGNTAGGTITLNGSTTAASKGGAETVNIKSMGSANSVTAIVSQDSVAANVLKMANVSGDQNFAATSATGGFNLVSGGMVDASTLTGKFNATVNATAGAVTVKGGTADNRIILDAIGSTDIIDAGAGKNDTVGIFGNTAVASGGMAGTKNAEIFEIAGTSTVSQDVDNIGAFGSYLLSSSGVAAGFFDLADNANVAISTTTIAAGTTLMATKTDGVADVMNVSLNNGTAATAQAINDLKVGAGATGAGIVETVNVNVGSTGGVTIGTNTVNARDYIVTGGDNFNAGTLLAATTNFNASAATGNITVADLAAGTIATSVQTGSGNDNVTLNGAGGGDTTVSLGAGNDTLTVAGAQEHKATLGAGTDTVLFNDVATALGAATAISTATEFLTIADFVGADDTIQLENAVFAGAGVATAGNLAAANYIEGTLASTAALDNQVEGIASAGGIVAGQAYIAAIQIGTDVHVFYDSDGHAAAGNVSQIAVLSSTDLANVSVADFVVV